MPIDLEPEVEIAAIAHLVGGHEPWSDRAERIAALPFYPLPSAFQLIRAFRDVMDDAVSGHVRQRVLLGHVFRGLADHDAEFDFPVRLDRAARQFDVVVRPDDAGGGLHEDDGFFRNGHARFGGMIGVVQADANELADAADAGTDARCAVYLW